MMAFSFVVESKLTLIETSVSVSLLEKGLFTLNNLMFSDKELASIGSEKTIKNL